MNKYQKIITAIIVTMAVVITGITVFLATSCSKTKEEKNTNKFQVETTSTIEITTHKGQEMYVNDSGVYLRSSPSTEKDPLDILEKGTKVISIGEYGEWIQVKLDSRTGFIHHKFLSTNKDFNKQYDVCLKPYGLSKFHAFYLLCLYYNRDGCLIENFLKVSDR